MTAYQPHKPGRHPNKYYDPAVVLQAQIQAVKEEGYTRCQVLLVYCAGMRDYWCELQKHFHDNTDLEKFKISRIHIRKQHNSDMLFKMNYEEWRNDPSPEDDIIIGKRCLVKAEVFSQGVRRLG